MQKVTRLSGFLKRIFILCLMGYAFLGLYSILTGLGVLPNDLLLENAGYFFMLSASRTSKTLLFSLEKLSLLQQILYVLVALSGYVLNVVVLGSLVYLFRFFEKGEVFTPNTVKIIERISTFLLLSVVYSPISEGLLTFIVTMNYPVGERHISLSFGINDVIMLLWACITFVIAWIMKEGCKLQHEYQYTV